MRAKCWKQACLLIGIVLVGTIVSAQQPLPFEPSHDYGQSVTGAFEGWFQNADGTYSILLGYFNRNGKQELDIPVGPNNRIEPGGPDQGQPVHFLAGRMWGIFTITVPKTFGKNKLTWTLTANGQTTVIPMSLDTLWELSPFIEASGNTPPTIAFSEGGPSVQGPKPISTDLTTTLPNPVTLTVWVTDDAKSLAGGGGGAGLRGSGLTPVTLTWSKFRGPGAVTFANPRPRAEKVESKATPAPPFSGKATTTATFSEPGEYILRIVANDLSGDGGRGFQCCWTNAMVRVTVKPTP